MVGVIDQNQLSLNSKLINEVNQLAESFDNKNYSKVENVDRLLLNRDVSVEKKKKILIRQLHNGVVKAFSIKRQDLRNTAFESLKKRLHNIRKLIIKLRSINYYLETTFLEESKISKLKISYDNTKLRQKNYLTKNELEMLEYTAYKLIEGAVMLDKRLLKEYGHKVQGISSKEKIEVRGIGLVLKKQSELLEHLEAKLPPPKAVSAALMKDPKFTHWAARVFALLAYVEHLYTRERIIFAKLKKNKALRRIINKKIINLIGEKSKLLKIMQDKSISMKKFRVGTDLKKELHNFTTTISL